MHMDGLDDEYIKLIKERTTMETKVKETYWWTQKRQQAELYLKEGT